MSYVSGTDEVAGGGQRLNMGIIDHHAIGALCERIKSLWSATSSSLRKYVDMVFSLSMLSRSLLPLAFCAPAHIFLGRSSLLFSVLKYLPLARFPMRLPRKTVVQQNSMDRKDGTFHSCHIEGNSEGAHSTHTSHQSTAHAFKGMRVSV